MSTCLYILTDLSHHVCDPLHNIINSQVSLQILAQDDAILFKKNGSVIEGMFKMQSFMYLYSATFFPIMILFHTSYERISRDTL